MRLSPGSGCHMQSWAQLWHNYMIRSSCLRADQRGDQYRMFRSYSWDDGRILRCFCEGDLNGIIMLFRECLEIVNYTLVIKGEEMRWNCRNHGMCYLWLDTTKLKLLQGDQ